MKSARHRRKSVRKFAQQDSAVSVNRPWVDFAIFLSPARGRACSLRQGRSWLPSALPTPEPSGQQGE